MKKPWWRTWTFVTGLVMILVTLVGAGSWAVTKNREDLAIGAWTATAETLVADLDAAQTALVTARPFEETALMLDLDATKSSADRKTVERLIDQILTNHHGIKRAARMNTFPPPKGQSLDTTQRDPQQSATHNYSTVVNLVFSVDREGRPPIADLTDDGNIMEATRPEIRQATESLKLSAGELADTVHKRQTELQSGIDQAIHALEKQVSDAEKTLHSSDDNADNKASRAALAKAIMDSKDMANTFAANLTIKYLPEGKTGVEEQAKSLNDDAELVGSTNLD